MNAEAQSELARIREARMRISEEFGHDPELLVKHYMELQKRHEDRLVRSTDRSPATTAGAVSELKGSTIPGSLHDA